MIKDKKGNMTDPFVILLIISFLAIAIIMGVFINTILITVISDSTLNDSIAAPSIIAAYERVNTTGVQQSFGMVLMLLAVFTILSAFLVRQHPAFMVFNIILLLVTLFTSIIIANVYGRMMDTPQLLVVMEQQAIIHYTMTNLLIVMLAFGALNMVVLYSKIFGAPQGGGDFG